jgi:transposase
MPAEMSVDLKQHIIDWYLVDQYTYRQIAGLADCSIGHVSNVMRNFREFGQVKNPFSSRTSRTGRPSQIEGDIIYLHALLEANPALYLDELQTRLLSVRNINLSIATISRILAQYELTRKRLHKVAAERDEELRGIWEADMAQYQDPDVFVALDKSAVDVKTLQRRFGRSLAGTPCVQRAAFLRGTRYS